MKPSDISRWQGSVDSWLDQGAVDGRVVNPGSGALIVDTGPLAFGWYDFRVHLLGDVTFTKGLIEHRDLINSNTLYTIRIGFAIATGFVLPIINWKIASSERLRVITSGSVTGVMMASIWWVKRG